MDQLNFKHFYYNGVNGGEKELVGWGSVSGGGGGVKNSGMNGGVGGCDGGVLLCMLYVVVVRSVGVKCWEGQHIMAIVGRGDGGDGGM